MLNFFKLSSYKIYSELHPFKVNNQSRSDMNYSQTFHKRKKILPTHSKEILNRIICLPKDLQVDCKISNKAVTQNTVAKQVSFD